MKVAGIIAEYNPFHNGHEYHFKMAREHSDAVVTVMSGNFVQRAEPAIMSKFSRAKAAVDCGVDLVIELPVYWSVASAQRFAYGGVSLLNSLGCVDCLCFGSESGDLEAISNVARFLNSVEASRYIKENLSSSKTFARIREEAVEKFLGAEKASLLKNPNDILGIEYCSELFKIDSIIKPIPIKRVNVSHDSVNTAGEFASASYIRKLIRTGEDFSPFVPKESFNEITRELKDLCSPADISYLERSILSALRNMKPEALRMISDVGEGLENRIIECAKTSSTLHELFDSTKTKRYTHSRIRRIVLSAFLDIADMPKSVPFLRVLAFNETGAALLGTIKKSSSLPIIVNKSDLTRCSDEVKELFKKEINATDLFSLMLPKVQPFGLEFTSKIYKKLG